MEKNRDIEITQLHFLLWTTIASNAPYTAVVTNVGRKA